MGSTGFEVTEEDMAGQEQGSQFLETHGHWAQRGSRKPE